MKRIRSSVIISFFILTVLFVTGCGSDAVSSAVEKITDGIETIQNELKDTKSDSGEESFFGYVEIPDGTFFIDEENDITAIRDKMAEALENREGTVCVRNHVWFNTPDFYEMPYGTFWLEDYSAKRYWGKRRGDKENSSFDFYEFNYYDLSDEEILQMKEEIDTATAEIIDKVTPKAKTWGKSKTVHDELCRLITYSESDTEPHCHDLYGALVNHSAVCSGYACAFTHVMGELGLQCPLSYSEDHAWNYVINGSQEQYIDVTWDDTDMTDRDGNPYIDYSHFFLTREECESIDSHSIQSFDPYNTSSNGNHFNYYYHEGYFVESYDYETIFEMLRTQYEKGKNLLTVRFADEEDFEIARSWQEDGGAGFNDFMSALEYYEPYYYWYNDTMKTVSIGLYADAG